MVYRPEWIIITECKICKILLFNILSSTNNYQYKNVLLVLSNLLSIRKSYSQHYSYLRVVDICQYETVLSHDMKWTNQKALECQLGGTKKFT